MDFLRTLMRLITALADHQVEYILIGGAALNVHGLARATQDIDLFIAPSDANVQRLKAALRAVWDDPHIEEISAADLCGDYPAVRYGPPVGDVFLDILTRLGTAFRYEDLELEEVDLGGATVRVATPQTLYRLKKDTVRPIDRADALALKEAFDLEEEEGDAR